MRLKSKRLISLLLAGSMMVSMLPASAVTAFAETTATAVVAENSNTETSGTCGATESDSVHWNYASGVLSITGTGAMKDYETKGTNPDLAVDDNGVLTTDTRPWAKYLNDIVELRVENGITAIGKNALAFCKNLKKLNLDGVTDTISIHGAAFGHTGIEELDIPATVGEIGNYAFNACDSLKKVTFHGNTKLLGTPFPNESALEELVIADNAVITAADKNGSSNNSRPFGANMLKSLKKLELLGEFKDVDSSATTKNEGLWDATFSANTELTDVTVSGSNMQYVSRAAFPAIKTLNVVGGNATAKFMCTSRETNNNLENISIDVGTYNGVKEAFNGATALKTFVLKANTVTLGEYEFGRDNSLKAIDLSQCGNVTYGNYCFGAGANAATKAVVYVKDSSTAPSNAPCAVLVVNGGNVDLTKEGFDSVTKTGCKVVWYEGENATTDTKPTAGKTYTAKWAEARTVTFDLNGVAGKGPDALTVYEGDKVTAPKAPTADGYKFDGWYTDKDCTAGNEFKFADAEGATTITDNTIVYAKWTPYKTTVEPKVEANVDPASKTVEITVNVDAVPAELANATATLNFTDANGNDDSANVAEVAVDGKKLEKDENDKYTAKLSDLMQKTFDASENGAEAVMLADVNAGAVVSGTVKGTALLTVTYKTPGKHRVEIVLNAANGDVICTKTATVEIAPEPGTLNFTGCTATLKDGTPVENGAKVPVGAEVTVTFDKDADSDLVLNGWKVTPETLTDTNGKLVKDITADTFTFVMPETDEGVTIEALTKAKAAAPAEDDSMDAAAVVTGVVLGTGTAILAYHIGTEVYAEQVLGKGVAIPRTREEVALKAWELAGKPAVELNGEPLSEAAQAEKWAVESGLMQNVDGSFNGSKKMSKLKALRTLDAAKKLG